MTSLAWKARPTLHSQTWLNLILCMAQPIFSKKKTLVGKQKGILSNTWLNSDCQEVTGRSLHCQVEHHVQTKFATPILHAIDNLKIDDISPTYT